MGVQCQILINKAKEGVHRPGQAVTGRVKYVVDEPTEYQDVTLSFKGKGKCRWSRGSGKNRRTYHGSEEYIIRHVNICNIKPEDTITLDGEYEHPFEFYLPVDIPRSYKDWIGSISYRIQLKFVKPSFFSFKKVFTAEIPVYGYIKPTQAEGPIIFGLEKSLFAPFSSTKPVVNLKAEIEKTCLTPGENAHLSYVVTNNTDVEITAVRTNLYCYTTYTSDCENQKIEEELVKSCETETPAVPEREESRFTCVLPTLPELYSIQQSKIISKEYRVRVTVRLPVPHINASVEVPVLIGEQRGTVDSCVEMEDTAAEQPPSYWEAMNEKKTNDERSKKEKN